MTLDELPASPTKSWAVSFQSAPRTLTVRNDTGRFRRFIGFVAALVHPVFDVMDNLDEGQRLRDRWRATRAVRDT